MVDVHGNLAGTQASGSDAVVSALRYDPYGQLLDSYSAGSGSTATPWRFQGRLDLSPDADEPLYDYGARLYRPSAGTFTQLDTYAGQAQNPLSMNRYLYAHANPATLIDPTGHAGAQPPMIDGTCVPKSCGSIPPAKAEKKSVSSGGQHQFVIDAGPLLFEDRFPSVNVGLTQIISRSPASLPRRHPCYRFNCSPEEIEALSPSLKLSLVFMIESRMNAHGWFNGVKDIIRFMTDEDLLGSGSWTSTVDSYILGAIQDGAAIANPDLRPRTLAGAIDGTEGWTRFFTRLAARAPEAELLELWGTSEQAATDYGVTKARSIAGDPAAQFALISMGNIWREGVAHAGVRDDVQRYLDSAPIGGLANGGFLQAWSLSVQNQLFDPRTEGFSYAAASVLYRGFNQALSPPVPPVVPISLGFGP